MTINHLLVTWCSPTTGTSHVIGHLERDGGVYMFWYNIYRRDATGLMDAQREGFQLMPCFPELRMYFSSHLFTVFAERIPSRRRADSAAWLESIGATSWDEFEILAKSGGRRATDHIELEVP